MLRMRTALVIAALAGTTSIAAAQTVVLPADPSEPATTGTVVVAPAPVAPAPGVLVAPITRPNANNPTVTPSYQNRAVDEGARHTPQGG